MFSIINNRSSFVSLTVLLLAGLGACTPAKEVVYVEQTQPSDENTSVEDSGTTGNDDSTIQNEDPDFYPQDCQDLADADPSLSDGKFTLYVNGDRAKPWTAYCAGMPNEPQEYLVLKQVGGGSNEAEYPCDGWANGSTVQTVVEAVAINPRTFKVDTRDLSFSSSSGACNTFTHLTELPWGYAGTCNGSANGTANIDLTGTPFVVEENAFAVEGWQASGTAEYLSGGREISLQGGGACGSMSPASSDGSILLKYKP